MRQKLFFLLLTLLCSVSVVIAQRTISGTVTDENNEPLPGATLVLKGAQGGVITNIEGKYSIRVPAGATGLVISYTGYVTRDVPFTTGDVYDITMELGATGLAEMVVTGYGLQQNRKELTGAVGKVGSETIGKLPVPGIDQALQGQTAGVFVTAASGAPGSSVSLRVRGPSSITAGNQPLYVVDGVPMTAGNNSQLGFGGQQANSLIDINPADIESVEVLKDAASAAIYGSRASNGVVLITTKRGKSQKTAITLNTYYGQQSPWRRLEPLSGPEYVSLLNEAIDNRFGAGNATGTSTKNALGITRDPASYPNTNWQDEIFRTAAISQTDLSMSGGNDRTRFFASGSYFTQEGTILGSSLNRGSLRVNLDNSVTDKLRIGLNTYLARTNSTRINNDNNIFGVLSTALLLGSHIAVRNPDGTYARDPNSSVENPVAAAIEPTNPNSSNRLISALSVDYDLFKNLTWRSTFNVDWNYFREFRFDPTTTNSGAGVRGRAIEANSTDLNLINENFLTWTKSYGDFGIKALGGVSFQNVRSNSLFAQGENFPSNTVQTFNAAAVKKDITSNETVYGINSYFTRAIFDWKDIYTLSASIRADGSSRFGVNNRWGYFPALSAAILFSDMEFLKNNRMLSLLKLRGSWGKRGNQNINNFASRALIGPGANYNQLAGLAPSQLGNPDLTWEERADTDLGLDMGFLKNRITLTVDVFKGLTNNLLLNRPLVRSSGFDGINENIGKMENKGLELELSTQNIARDHFGWSTKFNMTFLQNKVLKLAGAPFPAGFASWVAEGGALGDFRGWRVERVFQTQAEIDQLNASAREKTGNANAVYQSTLTRPGDLMFRDINGDGVVTGDDQEILGNGNPDFYGGLTNNFSFYGFDLSFFLQFQVGNEVYNNTRAFSEGMNSVFGQAATVRNRWTPSNPTTDIHYPRAVWADPNNNRRVSDRYIDRGDYMRLRNVNLSYRLPKSAITRLHLANARVYVTGQNLLTFTKYPGLDPEISTFGETNIAPSTDFLTFPQARTISGGLSVTF